MYNLLVADDEVVLAEGIARDIDWAAAGVEQVFVAEDGDRAIELMRENRVDIVVTDIRMPGRGGIDLARHIRDEWPFAKVIFLTGYDEFDYAQKAIDLAVHRYLMKPVSDEELVESVKEAGAEITREIESTARMHALEERVESMLPFVRERFLRAWIEGRQDDALDRSALLAQYGLDDLPESSVVPILVRRDAWLHESRHRESVYQLTIGEMADRILFREEGVPQFWTEQDDLALLPYVRGHAGAERMREYALRMAPAFRSAVRQTLGVVVSIITGPVVEATRAPDSFHAIRDHLRTRYACREGKIIDLLHIVASEPAMAFGAISHSSELAHYVDTLQEDEALSLVEATFADLTAHEHVSKESIVLVYARIIDALYNASLARGIAVEEWIRDPKRLRFSFDLVRSIEELKGWALENIRAFMRRTQTDNLSNRTRFVKRAKRVIHERLSSELSVASIAEELDLNANYLSTAFSKSEGMPISEYITKQRIDAARMLLRSPGVKTYEVAEQVGYRSVAHFNRTFKRHVGMSPKRFQLSG